MRSVAARRAPAYWSAVCEGDGGEVVVVTPTDDDGGVDVGGGIIDN